MKTRYAALALAAALAVILAGCAKSQPKDPAEPALRSYQEMLKGAPAIVGEHMELQDATFGDAQNRQQFGEHYDQFAVVDLNKDGIPELIASSIINFRWMPISVFTYADGKAVLLRDPLEEAGHGTFEQCSTAGGAYVTFLCPENHIHSLWRGSTPVGEMEENHAYVLNGTALTAVDCTATEGVFFDDLAEVNTEQNAAALIP